MNLSQRIALYTRHTREFTEKVVHNLFQSEEEHDNEYKKLLLEKENLLKDCEEREYEKTVC